MDVKKQNILLVSNSFDFGGKEKVLLDLARNFPSFQIQPFVVILSRLMGRQASLPDAQAAPPRFPGDWRPVAQMLAIMKQNAIGSILCFDFFSYFYVRLAILTLREKPRVIIALHNSDFTRRMKVMLQAWLWRLLITKSDSIVAICNYQAQFYAKIFYIDPCRFTIIYNGIDVSYYAQQSSRSREVLCSQYHLPSRTTFVLQVGGLRTEKKHEDSIKALRILHDTYGRNDVSLLIVGGGTAAREHSLHEDARRLSLEDAVYFLGKRDDVRDFLSLASLFTLSSVEIETFSIATLEAMASGLPCVLTRVGGAAELIVEGMNGYTVPPHHPEALAERWNAVLEQRSSFSPEAISDYVQRNFSIEKCTQAYSVLVHQSL